MKPLLSTLVLLLTAIAGSVHALEPANPKANAKARAIPQLSGETPATGRQTVAFRAVHGCWSDRETGDVCGSP